MRRREVWFPLAGFLVSPIGRFWVSPEAIGSAGRMGGWARRQGSLYFFPDRRRHAPRHLGQARRKETQGVGGLVFRPRRSPGAVRRSSTAVRRKGGLMRRYRNRPMFHWYACLVRLSEIHAAAECSCWTLTSNLPPHRQQGNTASHAGVTER